MSITSSLLKSNAISILNISKDTTLSRHYDLVEIDATSGNIIITLPVTNSNFKNKGSILFKRIDTTENTVTFIGTNGNFEDENLQIGLDPQLETLTIYASKANIWRTV